MVSFGGPATEAAVRSIDLPTILLPCWLMVVSAQLRLGGFYTRVAPSTVSLLARPRRFLLAVMAASTVLSPPPAAVPRRFPAPGGCPSTGGRPGRGCWR